jgi:hypothetical protein
MTNKLIGHILELHNATWWEENGHIFCIEYFTTRNGRYLEEVTDLTGYNKQQLRDYLNY